MGINFIEQFYLSWFTLNNVTKVCGCIHLLLLFFHCSHFPPFSEQIFFLEEEKKLFSLYFDIFNLWWFESVRSTDGKRGLLPFDVSFSIWDFCYCCYHFNLLHYKMLFIYKGISWIIFLYFLVLFFFFLCILSCRQFPLELESLTIK